MFQGCFNGVLRMFQAFQGNYTDILRKLQGRSKGVFMEFEGCVKEISRVFH